MVILVIAVGAGVYFATSGGGGQTTITATTGVTTTKTTGTTGTATITTTTTTGPTTQTTGPGPTPAFVSSNTFVWETPANYQYLDPDVSYYQYDYGVFQNVFEKLLWYNGDNSTQLIPWLASSYTVNPAGTQYTFTLRQGINFADGTPFNATAVWFSLNRLLIMDGTSGTNVHGSQAAWILQQLLNTDYSSALCCSQSYNSTWVQDVLAQNFVQIVDNYHVTLNVQHPTAAVPYLLANEWADILSPSWVVAHDVPSAVKGAHNFDYNAYFDEMAGNGTSSMSPYPTVAVMAGTGPYYLDSVNPTTYNVVLKANPNYWGGPSNFQYGTIGKAKISTIQMLYVPDLNTRLLDLRSGKATQVTVGSADIYSVADRNSWLNNGQLVSTVSGATIHGTYPNYITDWFEFGSNITTPSGQLRSFQPFADWRFRQAVSVSVNMTSLLNTVGNRLFTYANMLIPPGTAPTGSYDPTVPGYTYNQTRALQLLQDAMANPLTSFHYYNGTAIPSGIVNNAFGPNNPQTIQLQYNTGDTLGQNIESQIATNLNTLSVRNHLGLTFVTVPIPSAQHYTLMSLHQLDFAWAGWVADYNWVTDWTVPMYLSTGTYFSWSMWNYTALDSLVHQINTADAAGNIALEVSLVKQANILANQLNLYMWEAYPVGYAVTSSWLQGFYWNAAIGSSGLYFPTYSFAAPS